MIRTNNILRILLISIISAQITWAKPTTDESLDNISLLKSQDLCLQKTKDNNIEPSESDSLLSPSNQLLKFTLQAFQEMSLKYVKKAKNISEHMLRNNDILSSQSAKILEFKQNLTKFSEKYTLCDGIDELFELVDLYSSSTTFYFELKQSSLDNDAELILKLLRQYGSEDLDQESLKLFNTFVDKFDQKFEQLKEKFLNEEGKLAKDMVNWFRDFKALNNYDDKTAAFEKFFTIFEEEQE